MQVRESRPTEAPGVCFICEASPDTQYIDTLKNHDPAGHTHLRGRKYICFYCVEQFAKIFGFLNATDKAKLEAEIVVLQNDNAELKVRADLAAVIKEAADVLSAGVEGKAVRDAQVAEAKAAVSEAEATVKSRKTK